MLKRAKFPQLYTGYLKNYCDNLQSSNFKNKCLNLKIMVKNDY